MDNYFDDISLSSDLTEGDLYYFAASERENARIDRIIKADAPFALAA